MATAPAMGLLPPPGVTHYGVRQLRLALDRFEVLVGLALGVSAIVLAEDLLNWLGITNTQVPVGPRPFAEWWPISFGLGLQVALGVAIAILVIVGIVYALLGLAAWRRGTLAIASGAAEFGDAQLTAASRARQDHSTTLWMFLAYVGVAIAISIAIVAVNGALSVAQASPLPAAATSVATSLGVGLVLVAIYYLGTRQLVGSIWTVSAGEGRRRLEDGRRYMVVGAVVGLGAALGALSPFFDAFAVASLVLILWGVHELSRGYSLWLDGAHPNPVTSFAGIPAGALA